MSNHCPLCTLRVSDWMVAWGKTITFNGVTIHKSCFMDFQLRHGKDLTISEVIKRIKGD